MEKVPDAVKRLVEENAALEFIDDGKKVKCTLTSHEIPAREDLIKLLIGGKKYQKQLKLKQFDYDQFKPHIVPSEKKWNKVREQLFCKLTLRHLNRDPAHVQKYVSGKRYTSALARWEECQRMGQAFHPRGGSKNKDKEGGAGSGSDDDDEDDDDEESAPKKKQKKPTKKNKKDVGKDGGWKDLESMMEKDSGDESSDSQSDLYPAADFVVDKSSGDEDAKSGSDSEFDEDEEIPEPTKKTQKAGQKRKGAADTPSNTKQKPQKKKQKPSPTEGKKQKPSPTEGKKQKQSPNKETKQQPNPSEGNKKKQPKKKKTKKIMNSVTLSI